MGNLLGKAEVRTEITVNAPIDACWSTLGRLDQFHTWNQGVTTDLKSSTTKPGENTTVTVSGLRIPVQIKEYVNGKGWAWGGQKDFLKPVFDGYHYMLLEKIDSRTTRLIHGERFSGLLAFVLKLVLLFVVLPKMRKDYRKVNEAFKAEVETKYKTKQ